MSPLEQRCRILLLAYPVQYRRDRGAEIVETLLLSTPPGRRWPLLRDVQALIAGGLLARADLVRQRSGARELSAALAGVSAYLCLLAGRNLTGPVRWLMVPAAPALRSSAWLPLLAQLVVAAAVLLAWCCRSRAIVVAGALAAGAAACFWRPLSTIGWGTAAAELACLAAVTALSGGDRRPDRRWLWPIGMLLAVQVLAHPQIERALTRPLGLPPHAGSAGPLIRVIVLAGIGVAAVAWIGIDLALAGIALAVFLLAAWLATAIESLSYGAGSSGGMTLFVGLGALAAGLVWRLRRQSAH
jgi:hypothetical protein